MNLEEMGSRIKDAAATLAATGTAEKNRALLAIADALEAKQDEILAANAADLEKGEENGVTKPMLDRLMLNEKRISDMAVAVRKLVSLADPIGVVESGRRLENGLLVTKVRVPLGAIGIIFESRPNVTVDAATLCLKAGNAVLLRGGKEAIKSNTVLVEIMQQALEESGLPRYAVQLVTDTSHETAAKMMQMKGYLDVLIPRGSARLIRAVVEQASVPVIETGSGNCHIYVDAAADLDMAVSILDNAKTSRPAVCNAVETLLVHRDVAKEFLPMAAKALAAHKVELRGCEETCKILPEAIRATEADWDTEYDDYILAIRVVDSLDEAIAHIRKHSTQHSETIVTGDLAAAQKFQREVDSAAVYVNASTRFTDGGEFGLGAEIGISTQKLHARGPMGLQELTSYKYLIEGNGQIRV